MPRRPPSISLQSPRLVTRLAVFYLLQAACGDSFGNNKTEDFKDGPAFMTSHIAELTQDCQIYRLFFCRERVVIRHSQCFRKATGALGGDGGEVVGRYIFITLCFELSLVLLHCYYVNCVVEST